MLFCDLCNFMKSLANCAARLKSIICSLIWKPRAFRKVLVDFFRIVRGYLLEFYRFGFFLVGHLLDFWRFGVFLVGGLVGRLRIFC